VTYKFQEDGSKGTTNSSFYDCGPSGKRLPCLLDSWQNLAGEPDEFFFCPVIEVVPPMFICSKMLCITLFRIRNILLFPEPDLFVPGLENEG